ncbi:MAG: hypothetical protein LKK08_06315 [Bacteroidales bacterium]|nr:hypothetical protein [Bacteroidales bacterium]
MYSYEVYLDADCRDFALGEKVRLYGSQEEDGTRPLICEKTVQGFHHYQLSSRLWL